MARYTKLQRANYKLIEEELRNYRVTKRELEQARENIIHSTSRVEGPAAVGQVGDPTGTKAVKLYSVAVMEAAKRVEAIEHALTIYEFADPRRVRAIELKYIDNRLNDDVIADRLGVTRQTVGRWKNEFIRMVAERLGWDV